MSSDAQAWLDRGTSFAILGRLHREPPDDGALHLIAQLVDEWPGPRTGDVIEGLARLRRSAARGEDGEAVRADHDRLYGVSAKALVPPYESVHRGVDGLVFDTQTIEVRGIYRASGLQAPRLGLEPDDHLGLEFDFMAQALLRAAQGPDGEHRERALAPARDFLVEHLLAWAPKALDRVVELARTDFMAGVALLSRSVLDECRLAWEVNHV